MDDENEGGRILVGPEFLQEARLSDKGIDTHDNEDYNFSDKIENDETNNNSNTSEGDNLKRPVVIEEDKDDDDNKFVSNNPYGIAEFGKYPLFPVTPDRFNLLQQNPYFLPPNSYVPIPLVNQYLQRRAFNTAGLRYPQIISPYPSIYDQYNSSPYSPYRVFYAQ